eukprot:TRINITY_DN29425_c0_g1_i1.p1 TRINITY_DN29425_c0_g1~~TRINITY_DN29425_c0_g1_i1.p1  ORF type:complete len:867 (-),score=145.29 TRINITY_DN29425_c0_g1_i1:147-2747(-)
MTVGGGYGSSTLLVAATAPEFSSDDTRKLGGVDCGVSAGSKKASVCIYFGSQTGTAENFAHQLHEEASEQGIPSKVADLEHFTPSDIAAHRVIVLLVANTGEGEPTDNAIGFHNWMLDPQTAGDVLKGVSFTVFGLADRNYANFDRMGELTDGCMERLGAERIFRRGTGDDSDDIVRDFRDWKGDGLWAQLASLVGTGGNTEDLATDGIGEPVLRMATSVAGLPTEAAGLPTDVLSRFYFQSEPARVATVRELRQQASAKDGLSTVHVEFDVHGSPGLERYQAAGTVEILPENDPADVADILPLLGISEACKPGDVGDLDCCITFVPGGDEANQFKKPFPTPCSLREALLRYCDLRRAPTRRMLVSLRPRLEKDARDRIGRLLADEGAMRIIQDEGLNWTQMEFWRAFGVQHLPLSAFLLHCPRQRARPFTIASSPAASPTRIHLCVSLASRAAMPLEQAVAALQARGVLTVGCIVPKRPEQWFGVCSAWLCSRVRPGSVVYARARASPLRLPEDDVPFLMVGAGAGVAPFRAFWNELGAKQPKQRVAQAELIFGCRHPDHDWLYRAEMTQASGHHGPLSSLSVAFSRVGEEGVYDPSGCCGEHVQDQLKARAAEVRECVASGGIIYVCGSNAMGQGVQKVLGEILESGGTSLQVLQEHRRLIQEAWGEKPAQLDLGSVDSVANGETALEESLEKPLLEAVKNGNHCEVERLIAARADVNFQWDGARKYTRIGLRNEVGETALHWAALRGDDLVADWLLAADADGNLKDQDGKTPLHIAAFNGVINVSERLLAASCNPDAQDLRSNTPLHWVMLAGGSMRMVKLLLKHGARGDIANDEGDSPADVADDQGSDAASALIRKATAARK